MRKGCVAAAAERNAKHFQPTRYAATLLGEAGSF